MPYCIECGEYIRDEDSDYCVDCAETINLLADKVDPPRENIYAVRPARENELIIGIAGEDCQAGEWITIGDYDSIYTPSTARIEAGMITELKSRTKKKGTKLARMLNDIHEYETDLDEFHSQFSVNFLTIALIAGIIITTIMCIFVLLKISQ